jgi:hypothetical protein
MQVKEQTSKSIYSKHGYKDRQDYLSNLADNFGIDLSEVITIADLLGENEDFDGLVSSLEDYCL